MRVVGYRAAGERWIGSVRDGRVRPVAPMDDFYAAGGDLPAGRARPCGWTPWSRSRPCR